MSALDFLRSLGGMFAHRLRAALTLLGIVIGTGSIVLLASLIRGGETYLVGASQEVSNEDVIEVRRQEPPPNQQNRTSRALSRADADDVAEAAPFADAMVAAESSLDTNAHYDGRVKRVAIVSAGAATLGLYRLTIADGRALDDDDRKNARRVCVVGHEVYQELLREIPLGRSPSLEVDGRLFPVVGVLAKKPMMGSTTSTYAWDRKVLIPATTYDALYAASHEVTRIYVRGVGAAPRRTTARAALSDLILRRHLGIMNFTLKKDQGGGTEDLIFKVIHVLLLSTGVLALLASGVNIMNVMLVTVSERTREIGLRRAIGATPRSILLQFLLEAATLSFVGGIVGVIAGVLLGWAVALGARAAIGRWELVIPPWSVGLGLGLAIVTGLVFGILPAWRAARVSPIDALRSE